MSLRLMEEVYLGIVFGGILGGVTAIGVMYYLLRTARVGCGTEPGRMKTAVYQCGCVQPYFEDEHPSMRCIVHHEKWIGDYEPE